MNIIIPLGGKGERFNKFLKPKPLITVLDKEILFYVIDNLIINSNDKFFIIYNKDLDDYDFKNIISNKYSFINLIKLDYYTKGATETVLFGLNYIFNNFEYNSKTLLIDGDTFYKDNIINKFLNIESNYNSIFYIKNYDNKPIFSYIELNENNDIINIKEKNKISDNINTGAYGFNDINILYKYAKYVVENNIFFKNESYISCIINEMILNNEPFKGIELNSTNVFFLGTPEQVDNYITILNYTDRKDK